MIEPEEIIVLTLPQAAEQALWDLQQWVKDHPKDCECFTCRESIPDLKASIADHLSLKFHWSPRN